MSEPKTVAEMREYLERMLDEMLDDPEADYWDIGLCLRAIEELD